MTNETGGDGRGAAAGAEYGPETWLSLATDVGGLVVNVLLIVAVARWPLVPSQTASILLVHQCVADGLCCLLTTIVWIIGTDVAIPANLVGDVLCALWGHQYALWTCVQASINNLIVFTAERYLSVFHPAAHGRLGRGHVSGAFALCWTHAVLVCSVMACEVQREGDQCVEARIEPGRHIAFRLVYSFSFFVAPIVVVSTLNAHMILLLRKPPADRHNAAQLAASKELTITVGIAGASFLLLAALSNVLYVLYLFDAWTPLHGHVLFTSCDYLITLTFVVNPLVYALRMLPFPERLARCCSTGSCVDAEEQLVAVTYAVASSPG